MIENDFAENVVWLMDDPDYIIIQELNRVIFEQGEDIFPALAIEISKVKSSKRRKAMDDHLMDVNSEYRLNQFSRCLNESFLAELAYLVSASLDPSLTRQKYNDAYLPFMSEVLSEISDDKTIIENITIFNHIFFRRLKFTPSDMFMTQENTALLPEIFKTRKGNPITISVLYFMLAQSCGLDIQPMCFPGGFIPVCMDKGDKLLYINMFDGGSFLAENQIESFLGNHGMPISFKDFEIKHPDTVILIYIESLLFYYSSINDIRKEKILEELAKCFGDTFLTMDEDEEEEF